MIADDRSVAALQLIGAGVVSLAVIAPSLVAAARSQQRTLEMGRASRARLMLRFGLSGLSYLAVIAAGVLLLWSLTSVFASVIVAAIVVLLLVSLRNTWDLLVTVGDVVLEDEK